MRNNLRNIEIRDHARVKNVRLWEIAEKIGIQPETFSKKLRVEFGDDEKQRILNVIDDIAAGDQEVNG